MGRGEKGNEEMGRTFRFRRTRHFLRWSKRGTPRRTWLRQCAQDSPGTGTRHPTLIRENRLAATRREYVARGIKARLRPRLDDIRAPRPAARRRDGRYRSLRGQNVGPVFATARWKPLFLVSLAFPGLLRGPRFPGRLFRRRGLGEQSPDIPSPCAT